LNWGLKGWFGWKIEFAWIRQSFQCFRLWVMKNCYTVRNQHNKCKRFDLWSSEVMTLQWGTKYRHICKGKKSIYTATKSRVSSAPMVYVSTIGKWRLRCLTEAFHVVIFPERRWKLRSKLTFLSNCFDVYHEVRYTDCWAFLSVYYILNTIWPKVILPKRHNLHCWTEKWLHRWVNYNLIKLCLFAILVSLRSNCHLTERSLGL